MQARKEHWEKVYAAGKPDALSWTQELPKTSLSFIRGFNLPQNASIIDIGGGDSKLVDFLLDEGYVNITVLDISEKAIRKAKQRLDKRAALVQWIVCDITEFRPAVTYDCWHDRATFHFLTSFADIEAYLEAARQAISRFMVIGTFSDRGPAKCSRLDVHRYTEDELQLQLQRDFEKIKCITEDHITPSKAKQNFLFCSFKKRAGETG